MLFGSPRNNNLCNQRMFDCHVLVSLSDSFRLFRAIVVDLTVLMVLSRKLSFSLVSSLGALFLRASAFGIEPPIDTLLLSFQSFFPNFAFLVSAEISLLQIISTNLPYSLNPTSLSPFSQTNTFFTQR